jgi:hypothetical protein
MNSTTPHGDLDDAGDQRPHGDPENQRERGDARPEPGDQAGRQGQDGQQQGIWVLF